MNRREYTRNIRSVELRKCWPFSGDITGDLIHSLLPPITVPKFRWWSHELTSLLTKSPVSVDDDSDPSFRRKAKAKSKQPCKKRSIVEICAAAPTIQLPLWEEKKDDSDVLTGSKRKRTKGHVVQKKIHSKKSKDSGDQNFANKVLYIKLITDGVGLNSIVNTLQNMCRFLNQLENLSMLHWLYISAH